MAGLSVPVRPAALRLPRFVRQRGAPASEPRGIRRRKDGDVAACARLAAFSVRSSVRRRSWRAWLAADEVVEAWVAERHGELLGHVALSDVGADACSGVRWRELTGRAPSQLLEVSRLFVRPRVRGQGLGTALLETAVAGARAQGRIPVVEAVGAGPGELALYDRMGWRSVGLCPARLRSDGMDARFYLPPPAP